MVPRPRGEAEAALAGTLVRVKDLESEAAHVDPSVELVAELARRAETRGSDVRLDAMESMSPLAWPRRPVSAARWSWRTVATWRWARPSTGEKRNSSR